MVERNLRREKIVDKYAEKRAELKAKAKKGDREAIAELAKLPRNASPTRLRNRCQINGRPRGFMREFGISRVMFRKLAGEGAIPGVRKSSW
jgi:ribosomal protein S14p/S29e